MAVDIRDTGQPVTFHPEEAALVARAAEKRQRDFALGRHCARMALEQFGVEAPVLRNAAGLPLWPEGFVGSITHTRGYAAALVARREDFRALGVDAEQIGGVTDRLAPRLFDRDERAWLDGLDDEARARAATLLFSAKEAWFKCWSRGGDAPAFIDIHVLLADDSFTVSQAGVGAAAGRYRVADGLVVTCVCIPVR